MQLIRPVKKSYVVTFSYSEHVAYAIEHNLGNSYRKLEKSGEAIEVYQKIIELFPSTSMANRAQSYINELTEE